MKISLVGGLPAGACPGACTAWRRTKASFVVQIGESDRSVEYVVLDADNRPDRVKRTAALALAAPGTAWVTVPTDHREACLDELRIAGLEVKHEPEWLMTIDLTGSPLTAVHGRYVVESEQRSGVGGCPGHDQRRRCGLWADGSRRHRCRRGPDRNRSGVPQAWPGPGGDERPCCWSGRGGCHPWGPWGVVRRAGFVPVAWLDGCQGAGDRPNSLRQADGPQSVLWNLSEDRLRHLDDARAGCAPTRRRMTGLAAYLPVWVAVRASLRRVFDGTILGQLLTGDRRRCSVQAAPELDIEAKKRSDLSKAA